MPKHVAVLVMVMNCVLSSAFFGECMDSKNMEGTNNTTKTLYYPTDAQIYNS